MYHKYTFVIFSIVSSAAIIGFATISYVSLIGHYLYILHSEIRKSTFVETKEFYKILDYCKKKLQEMQHNVFVMKYMEDLDAEEICKVLNISSSNYWVIIHRAKLQLRKCIEQNWVNS